MACHKIPHETKAEAIRQIVSLRRAGRYKNSYCDPMEPYICRECGRWHVGHLTNRARLAQGLRKRRRRDAEPDEAWGYAVD